MSKSLITPLLEGLSDGMSGDWTNSVRTADNSREGSPAMKYLLELSDDKDSMKVDEELLPVPTFNCKNKKSDNRNDNRNDKKNNNEKDNKSRYSFFASLKNIRKL